MKSLHRLYLNFKASMADCIIKQIIIYLFIAISLFNTFYQMNQRYTYSNAQMFLNKTLPDFSGELDDTLFLKTFFYNCTNIMLGEPVTFLTQSIPYLRRNGNLEGVPSYDVPGYFDVRQNDESFIYIEENDYAPKLPSLKQVSLSKENYKNPYYVLKYFITGDSTLKIDSSFLKQWDFYSLMNKPLRINSVDHGPKILIFHTHAREKYKDGTTVVDVGKKLKKIFEEDYGLSTLHVVKEFYADDTANVTGAYEIMEKSIIKILKDHPSIEIVLDIHRDGVAENVHLMTNINNKDTAKIMFVNGLCMNRDLNGEIVQKKELVNPYINDNLAFSMQAQEMGYKYYPNLMKKVYLKEYRYSLHMKPLSLLVEIGAQTNTGEEALNAADPLANIIAKVIEKD